MCEMQSLRGPVFSFTISFLNICTPLSASTFEEGLQKDKKQVSNSITTKKLFEFSASEVVTIVSDDD